MVTPGGLAIPPISSTIDASPDERPPGTSTLICITPATRFGAPPAYVTFADSPPIVTATGSTGFGNGCRPGRPSTPTGVVCPPPVAYNVTTRPLAAGCEAPLIDPS